MIIMIDHENLRSIFRFDQKGIKSLILNHNTQSEDHL